MSWDDPRTRAFCERLVRRREVTWGLSPGALGEDLAEQASEPGRGWGTVRFVERVLAASSLERVEGRFQVVEKDRTDGVPAPVREGMNEIQKPFHLWNVERIVERSYYMLADEEPLKVGGAAACDPEQPRGMPALESASREAARELAAEERARIEEAREKLERQRLWAQRLPFGREE